MVANVLAAGFAALIAVILTFRLRNDASRSWFFLLAVGFGILTYELATAGKDQSVSVGVVMLAASMIAVLSDKFRAGNKRTA